MLRPPLMRPASFSALAALALCGAPALRAQSLLRPTSVHVGQTVATSLTTPFAAGPTGVRPSLDKVLATRLELGWRLWGSQGWKSAYGEPTIGVGGLHLEFLGSEAFGAPTAAYGFFHWPFLRSERVRARFDIGLGLAFGWRDFDPVTNPLQTGIGSNTTAMIEFTPTLEARVSDRLWLSLGAGYLHFSNGATSLPNGGVNLFTPTLGVSYVGPRSGSARPAGSPRAAPARQQRSPLSWRVSAFGGVKSLATNAPGSENEGEYAMRRVAVGGVSLSARRTLGRKSRALLGLDVTLDESGGRAHKLPSLDLGSLSASERMSLGVTGGYELVIGPGAVEADFGYTVARHSLENQVSRFYQKLGFTFRPSGQLLLGVAVRSLDLSVPDFIEWSIGFEPGAGGR